MNTFEAPLKKDILFPLKTETWLLFLQEGAASNKGGLETSRTRKESRNEHAVKTHLKSVDKNHGK